MTPISVIFIEFIDILGITKMFRETSDGILYFEITDDSYIVILKGLNNEVISRDYFIIRNIIRFHYKLAI